MIFLFDMCTQPIKILNPTKRYTGFRTKKYLYVPCGKCPSCQKQMQDGWMLRIENEIEEAIKSGGLTFFFTLTYKPEHLPLFDTWYPGKIWHNEMYQKRFPERFISCFDHDDVDRFVDSVKKYFYRKYNKWIRTFVACEFGLDDESTKRPHYHGFLHFPFACDVTSDDIKNEVSKLWNHGWSNFSDGWLWYNGEPVMRTNYKNNIKSSLEPKGIIVSDFEAAAYVSTYCTKDFDLLGKTDIANYLGNPENPIYDLKYAALKPYLGRVHCSRYYGAGLTKEIFKSDTPYYTLYHGKKFDKECKKLGKTIYHPYPRYIVNLLCYQDRNGIRTLSDFGGRYFSYIYDMKVRDYLARMREVADPKTLIPCIDETIFKTINKIYKNFNSHEELANYLQRSYETLDFNYLAYYRSHLQGAFIQYKQAVKENELAKALFGHTEREIIYDPIQEYLDSIDFDVYAQVFEPRLFPRPDDVIIQYDSFLKPPDDVDDKHLIYMYPDQQNILAQKTYDQLEDSIPYTMYIDIVNRLYSYDRHKRDIELRIERKRNRENRHIYLS